MKVRLCIHSDINNDDESRKVEHRGTKLRAFFGAATLMSTYCTQHELRACAHCGQDTHTEWGERF